MGNPVSALKSPGDGDAPQNFRCRREGHCNTMWALSIYVLLLGAALVVSSSPDCRVSEEVGAACDYFSGGWPWGDCDDVGVFYDCRLVHGDGGASSGLVSRSRCPAQHHFVQRRARCEPLFDQLTRVKRQFSTGLGRIGEACQQNINCDSGLRLYCAGGRCQCSPGYVQSARSSTVCIQQINPGQGPCSEQTQCTSVWAGTTCTNGQCACPTNEYATQTRDGFVCIRDGNVATVASCPLPTGDNPGGTPQGTTSLLYPVGDTTSTPVTCNQNTGCQVGGQSGISDMYDCVQKRNNGGSHCCPNRALTCIMPRNGGNGGATNPRYWYNARTDACEPFNYAGAARTGPYPEGNSNNFPTQAQCESYCRNRCERGQPGYTQAGFSPAATFRSCSAGSACANSNFECQEIGAADFRCCASSTFVCGINGGLQAVPQTPAPGFDGDGSTAGVQTVARYYFDSNTQQCRLFQWSQYGGSFNNFASSQECQDFCLNVCTNGGQPLKVNGGVNAPYQACPCPASYVCTNNLCCPTDTTVCNQALVTGDFCGNTGGVVQRWYYSTLTRTCQQFTYGGCNGNQNNFLTQNACLNACGNVVTAPTCPQGEALKLGTTTYQTCATNGGGCPGNYECINSGCCPTKTYTCTLTPAVGTQCGAPSTRYYFDNTDGRCKSFQYSGCDGNSNNFGTIDSCNTYCGSGGCPSGGTPQADPRISGAFLQCGSNLNTCQTNYECTTITPVSGIGTQTVCCPTRASVCQQGLNQGDSVCGTVFGAGSFRYYFDVGSRGCRQFNFNGCGGNQNNFPTVAECQNFCGSAACPAGQAVLGGTSSTSTCSVGSTNSCPSGYTCTLDTLNNRNVCCGASSLGCSQQETAYVDYRTNDVQLCQPGNLNACPSTEYFCKLDTQGRRYICCKPNNFCPGGYLPQLSNSFVGFSGSVSNSVQPTRCYINGFGSFGVNTGQNVVTVCGSTFSCQQTVPGSPTGYCCSTTAVCPGGQSLQPPNGGQYQTCTTTFNSCGGGYSCYVSNGFQGYCCGAGTGAGLCGTTGTVVTLPGSSLPQTCVPGQFCPGSATCTPSSSGLSYCCTGVSGICPGGTVQLAAGNAPQLCTGIGDNRCQSGYTCSLNSASGTYYCCSAGISNGQCTSGSAQTVNGIAVTCNPGSFGQCRAGYSCVGTGSNGVCCTTFGTNFCRSPYRAWLPGGSPVRCNGRDNRCPAGKVCQDFNGAVSTSTNFGSGQGYCCELDASVNVCPSGSPNLVGNSPQTCSGVSGCTNGFSCIFSSTASTSVCCSTGISGGCPSGLLLQPTTCSPQDPSRCGVGGQCVRISATSRFQCCTSNVFQPSLTCPQGGTSTSVPCNGGTGCSFGQTCQVVNGVATCCTGGAVQQSGVCPQGGTIQLFRSCLSTTAPDTNGACGLGNNCQLIQGLTPAPQYRCCNGVSGTGVGLCPNGGTASANICTPGVFGQCQGIPGSTCQIVNGVGRCCSPSNTNGVIGVGTACPSGGTIASPQRFCSPSPDSCGAGTRCQQISADSLRRYYCCTSTVVTPTLLRTCANGRPAYINPNTQRNLACVSGNTFGCPAANSCFGGICCQNPIIGFPTNPTNPGGSCEGRGNVNRDKDLRGNDLGCPLDGSVRCRAGFTCRAVTDVGSPLGACCRAGLRAQDDPHPKDVPTSKNKKSSETRMKDARLLKQPCNSGLPCKTRGATCNQSKKLCECSSAFVAINGTSCQRS